MSTSFESQKNSKAFMGTVVVHGLILLAFLTIAFKIPEVVPPVQDDGVEVNLGNSDFGLGDIQPRVPGEPAPAVDQTSAPAPSQTAQVPEVTKSDEPDDVPEVKKTVTKPKETKTVTENSNTKKTNNTQTAVTPVPAPPKPKAVYKGGTGTGGNNQDDFNKSRNEGIAGGTGDQGKPNGNPDSDSYTGTGGRGGPRITKGDRKIIRYYSFQGELKRAVIYADIRVSPAGSGQFVQFAKGSTTTQQEYKDAIIQYLKNIQFDKSDHESLITVQFNFNVNG